MNSVYGLPPSSSKLLSSVTLWWRRTAEKRSILVFKRYLFSVCLCVFIAWSIQLVFNVNPTFSWTNISGSSIYLSSQILVASKKASTQINKQERPTATSQNNNIHHHCNCMWEVAIQRQIACIAIMSTHVTRDWCLRGRRSIVTDLKQNEQSVTCLLKDVVNIWQRSWTASWNHYMERKSISVGGAFDCTNLGIKSSLNSLKLHVMIRSAK